MVFSILEYNYGYTPYVSLLCLSVGTSASVSGSVIFSVLTSGSSSFSPSISASLPCESFFSCLFCSFAEYLLKA